MAKLGDKTYTPNESIVLPANSLNGSREKTMAKEREV